VLAKHPNPSRRYVSTEINLVTAVEGARRAAWTLLKRASGHFHALCRDYELTGAITFGRATSRKRSGT
jgi:hypothetical protein